METTQKRRRRSRHRRPAQSAAIWISSGLLSAAIILGTLGWYMAGNDPVPSDAEFAVDEQAWGTDALKSELLLHEKALRANAADEAAARRLAIAYLRLRGGWFRDEDLPRAEALLGDAATLQGHVKQARLLASAYLEASGSGAGDTGVPPSTAEVLAGAGERSLALGDYPEAHLAFSLALEEDPLNYRALLGMAHTLLAEQRADEARPFVNRLLALRDDDARAWWLLGLVSVHGNDAAAAETALRRALELAPLDYLVADQLGWLLVMEDRPAEGIELLRQALASAPGDPHIRYHLAAALAKAGQDAESSEVLRQGPAGEVPIPLQLRGRIATLREQLPPPAEAPTAETPTAEAQ